jgi:hypothetical protein
LRAVQEADETVQARRKLIEALTQQGFNIVEEKKFPCKNHFDNTEIWPPYQADIYLELRAIIELDPLESHKSKHQKTHDKWKDTNIWEQYGVRTVRLVPEDIIKDGGIDQAGKEIIHQLHAEKYNQ